MDKVVKLKRFRPAFERGTVSEHQFLELQAETHRLKKEIANRDDQHKMLVVKLHRAQEAAKKNLRATVEQALVVSKDKNAVMAMFLQQNNAEEKIQELELKLREGHRDAKKYLEHSRESKAEAESLRKRLEGTVRASRRTRPPTPLDVSRRYEKLGGFHIFGVATQAACVNLPVDGEETEDAAYDFARGEQRVAKPDNRSADRWT